MILGFLMYFIIFFLIARILSLYVSKWLPIAKTSLKQDVIVTGCMSIIIMLFVS
jgi:hypothetical protein